MYSHPKKVADMDAVFLFSNNSSKVVATTINLAIITGLVFAQGILTSNPLLANELKLAQNVIAPIFDVKLSEENLYKNLTFEERKKLFDKKITKKYKNGVISDVDVGVKHIRLTKYYKGRSVRLNIVEINKELNPELELTPALASDTLANRRTISNIAKKNNSIVAINGTFFKPQTGVPLGTLMINKKMYTGPIYNRVAMGIFDNSYDMARIQLNASLKSKRTDIKVDNINQPRMLASYVLVYTNDWGKMSPASPKYGMQIAVDSENKILGHSYSAMQIPEGGFVIVG